MSKIISFLDKYGEKIGLCIITMVTLNDFFATGIRGFLEYGVGIVGMVVIWLSLVLIFISKKIRYDSLKEFLK